MVPASEKEPKSADDETFVRCTLPQVTTKQANAPGLVPRLTARRRTKAGHLRVRVRATVDLESQA